MHRERYDEVHNYGGTLPTTDQYHTIINVKIIFQNLLENYFNNLNTDYARRDPGIQRFQIKPQYTAKPRSVDPIKIVREFPRENRDYPFILVSAGPEFQEEKYYLGWDNIAELGIHNIDGQLMGEVTQGQNFRVPISLEVAAHTVDDRDLLIGYLQLGFQHYFRSNYKWISPDGVTVFFLHTGYKEITSNLDPTPVTDASGGNTFPIYIGSVSTEALVGVYYRIISSDYISSFDIKAHPGNPDPFSPDYSGDC